MEIWGLELLQSSCGCEETNLKMKVNTLKMVKWKDGKPGLDVFDLLN